LTATTLVRGLTAADDEAVAALCNKVGPDEWNEAGMSTGADFGHFQDQQLLAAANLGEWRGVPTLGVLTHPDWRGRGLGSAVVRLAARHALQRSDLIQYRARVSNAASIALAHGSGFLHYGTAVVVDVDDHPQPAKG